jgi:hypothetical protein
MAKYATSKHPNTMEILCPHEEFWLFGILELIFLASFRQLVWILGLRTDPSATMVGLYGSPNVVDSMPSQAED